MSIHWYFSEFSYHFFSKSKGRILDEFSVFEQKPRA